MYCFAPPTSALPAEESLLRQLMSADESEVVRRERVLAATAVASLSTAPEFEYRNYGMG